MERRKYTRRSGNRRYSLDNRDVWRKRPGNILAGDGKTNVKCRPIEIPSGTVMIHGTKKIKLSRSATFTPNCQNGFLSLSNFKGDSILGLLQSGNDTIMTDPPTAHHAPMNFTTLHGYQLPFHSSSIPVTYTIAGATAVIWMLFITLIATINRRPLFLIIVTAATVACITVISAEATSVFNAQYSKKYMDGSNLSVDLSQPKIAIFWAVANCALLLAEVRTVVRLFHRKKEKIIIFWLGVALTVLSGLFYILNIFAPAPGERANSIDAIIVLGYLFSMATSILFNTCIIFHTAIKYRVAFLGFHITMKTLVCNICALLPTVLFILDLSRTDIDGWAQLAGLVATMSASLSTWIWLDKLKELEDKIQQKSILGRQFFPEDHPGGFLNDPYQYDNERGRTFIKTKNMVISAENDSPTSASSLHKHKNSYNSQITKPAVKSTPTIELDDNNRFNIYLSRLKYFLWEIKRPNTTESEKTTYNVTDRHPEHDNISITTAANTNINTNERDQIDNISNPTMHIYNYPLRISRKHNDDNEVEDDDE